MHEVRYGEFRVTIYEPSISRLSRLLNKFGVLSETRHRLHRPYGCMEAVEIERLYNEEFDPGSG